MPEQQLLDEQKPAKSESTRKAMEVIEALCMLAAMNYPQDTSVRLSVEGEKHSGSIQVPFYELLAAIKAWRAA
jgi:hypothetical protein